MSDQTEGIKNRFEELVSLGWRPSAPDINQVSQFFNAVFLWERGMQLVQYEEARRALQICATVDEAKNILDKTSALQAYARQTDDTEMEVWLAEMKLRARRRIGEISRELEDARGSNQHIPSTGKKLKSEVLSDAGLSTSVANRCEKVAEIPEEEFESVIQDAKKKKKPVTYADVEKTVNRKKKEEKRQASRDKNKKKVKETKRIDDLQGVFSTIVIDPPWDWGDEGDKDQLGRAKPDYHTESLEDLKRKPIGSKAAKDAHIYLWITNRSLPKGFELLEAWGFRYITAITWVKPHFGMGNYFRGQTEQVLFGVKGSLSLKRKDQGTVFFADRGKGGHSSKPTEFYDLVESCSPGPYLEVFSRSDKDGWKHWGEDA